MFSEIKIIGEYRDYTYRIIHNRFSESVTISNIFNLDPNINGWYCGYVCVDKFPNIEKMDYQYMEENINCHGGITFFDTFYDDDKLYIGFDCNHLGDNIDVCTLEYCIDECKKIIDQLIKLTNKE